MTADCNGAPTGDWLRRQAIVTLKRPLPQPDQERTYVSDREYGWDHKHSTNLHAQNSLAPTEQPIEL